MLSLAEQHTWPYGSHRYSYLSVCFNVTGSSLRYEFYQADALLYFFTRSSSLHPTIFRFIRSRHLHRKADFSWLPGRIHQPFPRIPSLIVLDQLALPAELPSWLSEEDLAYYTSDYASSLSSGTKEGRPTSQLLLGSIQQVLTKLVCSTSTFQQTTAVLWLASLAGLQPRPDAPEHLPEGHLPGDQMRRKGLPADHSR